MHLSPLLPSLLLACAGSPAAPAPGAGGDPSAVPATPGGGADRAAHAAPTLPGPMDGRWARRTQAGPWTAQVDLAGVLSLSGPGGERRLDVGVDPRLAFTADGAHLAWAKDGGMIETDLWWAATDGGAPTRLTDWPGTEDRPVFSPDGRRLAFVSGRSGIASWWVLDLADPQGSARQLTNLGLEHTKRPPGGPPPGWVPVPDGLDYTWTEAGLSWSARGARHVVTP